MYKKIMNSQKPYMEDKTTQWPKLTQNFEQH
jgi:hypothetical protein